MTPVSIGSILALLIAIGWAVVLVRRFHDRRLGVLTAFLVLVAFGQAAVLLTRPESLALELTVRTADLPGLGVSALALLTVALLDHVASHQALARHAMYDRLTGLPNRAFFLDLLERTMGRVQQRKAYNIAVLFLDLDRFKVVNDTHGHAVGDQLLVAVAELLRRCLRPGDIVARLSGDEFCILLYGITDSSDATRVAKRVQEDLMAPIHLSGREIMTTASIGIASSESGYNQADHLLRDADTAMYRAKARGKARYELFDEAMHARAMALLELETDMRSALQGKQFHLVYQPVVAFQSGAISAFEALVRWQHPVRGTVSPAQFIPMAEETGLIIPLGWWVIGEACHQMAAWLERFPDLSELTVSVNLSAKQFHATDLVDRVAEAIGENRLDGRRLRFEITEAVLMDDVSYSTRVMTKLDALDVQLQIDDFGTGYSSFRYLHDFPIDTLKIDRSFVSKLNASGQQSEIVRAIIALARDLDVRVIAEGVETAEQSDQLKGLQCEHGQGYLFSEPLGGEAAAKLLEEQINKQ